MIYNKYIVAETIQKAPISERSALYYMYYIITILLFVYFLIGSSMRVAALYSV